MRNRWVGVLVVIAILPAVGCSGSTSWTSRVLSDAQNEVKEVREFVNIFPDAREVVLQIDFSESPDHSGHYYVAYCPIFQRYNLAVFVQVAFDHETQHIIEYGEPTFFLEKVTDAGDHISLLRFYAAEWDSLHKADGNFAALGVTLDQNNPKQGFVAQPPVSFSPLAQDLIPRRGIERGDLPLDNLPNIRSLRTRWLIEKGEGRRGEALRELIVGLKSASRNADKLTMHALIQYAGEPDKAKEFEGGAHGYIYYYDNARGERWAIYVRTEDGVVAMVGRNLANVNDHSEYHPYSQWSVEE